MADSERPSFSGAASISSSSAWASFPSWTFLPMWYAAPPTAAARSTGRRRLNIRFLLGACADGFGSSHDRCDRIRLDDEVGCELLGFLLCVERGRLIVVADRNHICHLWISFQPRRFAWR